MPSNEPGGLPRPTHERRMSRVHFTEDDPSSDDDDSVDLTDGTRSPLHAHQLDRPGIRPIQPVEQNRRHVQQGEVCRSDPASDASLSVRVSEEAVSPESRVPSRLVTQAITTDPNAHDAEGSRIVSRRPYTNPSPHIPDQGAFDTVTTTRGPAYPATPHRTAVPLKSALVNSPSRASVDERRISREDADLPVRPGRAYNPAVYPNLPAYSPRRRSGSVSFSEHRHSIDEKYHHSEDEDEQWERERLYASHGHSRPRNTGPRDSFASEYGFRGNYLASLETDQQLGQASKGPPPLRRRTTLDMEDGLDDEHDAATRDAINGNTDFHVQGGVFSQLLKLAGPNKKKKANYAASIASNTTTGSGFFPTMRTLGLKRSDSITSQTFEELDSDDPRITGVKKKKAARRHSMSELPFIMMLDFGEQRGKNKKRCASIQLHVADILTRQAFILKLAKALMMFGAPSHRIESQLIATALVLEIDAQFVHFPSIVVASFGDPDTRTSETHFIKAAGGDLDLGKLHQVHLIYKAVVHDELDAADGTRQIHSLLHSEREYKLWHRMIMAFLSCGLIAPMGFGGSFIDGLAAGTLGTMLSFMQLHVATRSSMYSNVFEGLSVTGYFCYGAVASAGVCLILPGYVILCGALELASKNIVAGSVRMVYAIIYSLFLGFGITIGSDLFYVVDPPARRAAEALFDYATFTTVTGSFTSFPFAESLDEQGLGQLGWNGTFTFSNATTDQILSAYQSGSITCPREAEWPWWRQSMPALYLLGFVPLYSALTALWSFQPLRSVELPVMVFISTAGYFANSLANKFIFDRSDVVSAIGAFVIGVLGNIYSRIFKGTAFTAMVPGVLFLVPSGISAAGGLAMTSANDNHEDSYSQGLIIGFRMVQVAIGITVGLFGSGFLIYSFGRKKNAALFAF